MASNGSRIFHEKSGQGSFSSCRRHIILFLMKALSERPNRKFLLYWLPGGCQQIRLRFLDSNESFRGSASRMVNRRRPTYLCATGYLPIRLGCPYGGTSLGKRSRGRQAADSIEPRVGLRKYGGGLCRGAADSLRLIAAVCQQQYNRSLACGCSVTCCCREEELTFGIEESATTS